LSNYREHLSAAMAAEIPDFANPSIMAEI